MNVENSQTRKYDPLALVRSFADSMAEGLLGTEDVGALYQAIDYAESQIRPVEQAYNSLLHLLFEMGEEQVGGGS